MTPRRRPITQLAATGLAIVAIGAAAGAASAQGLAFRACKDDPTTGCATLTVPLDHADPSKGTLDLAVQRRRGSGATKGVFVMLSGGPGQASLPISPYDRVALSMPKGWDYVAFDQRGTGAGALKCRAFDRPDPEIETPTAAATCAQQVGPTRAFFNSREAALDIEDLRVALGQPTLALGGVSYGTYVAQYYATLFPASLDHLVLDSVVNPSAMDGLELQSAQSVPDVLRGLCARGNCAGITTDPVGDVAALTQKSNATAVRGAGARTNGTPVTASVGGPGNLGDLPGMLFEGDLNGGLRALWPGAVRAALKGDAGPLIRVKALAQAGGDPGSPAVFSQALWAAQRCADGTSPWTTADPLDVRTANLDAAFAALPPDAFAPFTEANQRPDATATNCLGWPEGATDPLPVGPLPAVPALLLSGGQDMRTPTSGARDVATRLPRSTLLIAPGAGHDLVDQYNCAAQQVNQLLRDLPVNDRACAGITVRLTERTIPAPQPTVAAWSPLGAPGTAGRVAHAARFSIRDAMSAVDAALNAGLSRIQGVRGGTMTPTASRGATSFRFARYSDTAGVSVAGTLTGSGSRITGRVTVDGPGTMDGWLQLNNDGRRVWYSGRIGPSTVRITVR